MASRDRCLPVKVLQWVPGLSLWFIPNGAVVYYDVLCVAPNRLQFRSVSRKMNESA